MTRTTDPPPYDSSQKCIPHTNALSKDGVIEQNVEQGLVLNRRGCEFGSIRDDIVEQLLRQQGFVAQSEQIALFLTHSAERTHLLRTGRIVH